MRVCLTVPACRGGPGTASVSLVSLLIYIPLVSAGVSHSTPHTLTFNHLSPSLFASSLSRHTTPPFLPVPCHFPSLSLCAMHCVYTCGSLFVCPLLPLSFCEPLKQIEGWAAQPTLPTGNTFKSTHPLCTSNAVNAPQIR